MVELMDLQGNKKAKLTLFGAMEEGDELLAYGYLCRAPNAKKVRDESIPENPFMTITITKPLRKGLVFRAENKVKYRSLDNLEVDKVMVAGLTMRKEVRFRRID